MKTLLKHGRIPLHGIAMLIIPLLSLFFMPAKNVPANISTGNELRLPILMYHQLTRDECRVGEYCVTVAQLEKDLDALADMGYTAVSMAQVIDFCESGKPLPPNPIVLSFDDGFESFYVYAFPVLKKRNIRAVLAVIGEEAERFTQTEDHRLKYSCCTWPQLKEMADSGLVEIESHSWNLHYKKDGRFGAAPKNGESSEAYRAVLTKDVEKTRAEFKKNGLPDFSVYVYPFGEYGRETPEILRSLGVKAAFICDARVNILRAGDTEPLMRLKRFNRVPGAFGVDGQVLPAAK